MIYYFSATGNSQWVARQIAARTGDTATDMVDIVKGKVPGPAPVGAGEALGIVFPVHAWATPKYVTQFVRKMDISPDAFVYAIATCEAEAGHAFAWLSPHLHMDSRYVLCMPNDFVIWGLAADKARDRRVILRSMERLDGIAEEIRQRKSVTDHPREGMKALKSFLIAPVFRLTRSDRKFYANEDCIGCGRCEDVCPISDIVLQDGRPTWLHKHCMQCCACIDRCPVEAIQYGRATVGSGRYVFPEGDFPVPAGEDGASSREGEADLP